MGGLFILLLSDNDGVTCIYFRERLYWQLWQDTVTQIFKIREITPEKKELEITDMAQLISSSAFYWSTQQNEHWRTWTRETAKRKRLWDNQILPTETFLPSWSLTGHFRSFLEWGVKKSQSPAYFPCITAALPASRLSGLFVISRSALGFVLQPDHPWLQMSPWQEYTSSQERRDKDKNTCCLSCLLLLLFTHHFSESATHIRGQQTKQPWSLPEGPMSVLFL